MEKPKSSDKIQLLPLKSLRQNNKSVFLLVSGKREVFSCSTPSTWSAPSALGECKVSAIETEKLTR